MNDTDRRADLAVRAAEAGADLALDSFRGELSVETKTGKTDLVTETDRAAQERVIETIRERHPSGDVQVVIYPCAPLQLVAPAAQEDQATAA